MADIIYMQWAADGPFFKITDIKYDDMIVWDKIGKIVLLKRVKNKAMLQKTIYAYLEWNIYKIISSDYYLQHYMYISISYLIQKYTFQRILEAVIGGCHVPVSAGCSVCLQCESGVLVPGGGSL